MAGSLESIICSKKTQSQENTFTAWYLSSRIQSEIQEAISTWLPYINISNVNIIQSDEDPNTTSVDIDFALNYEPDRFNSITLNFDGDSESTSTSGGGGY